METSLNIMDYPNPPEKETKTYKVMCSFETYVTVEVGKYKDPDDEFEDIEKQIDNMSMSELLEECDSIKIEDFEEV